jgi:aldose sugar dehydrogenase
MGIGGYLKAERKGFRQMIRSRMLCLFLFLPACAAANVEQGSPNADFTPAFAEQTRAPALGVTAVKTESFATGLEHPWGIAALPGGAWVVTERPGRMRMIGPDGTLSAPIAGLPDLVAESQGGLLDVAADPGFASNRRLWWTYSKPVSGGSVTALARGTLSAEGSRLDDVADVFLQSPPSRTPMHYGSRIVFDGQGHVFATLGERSSNRERVLAQDVTTTYGKVVRLNLDGSVPSDNPFVGHEGEDAIWSLGHRNPQGAAMQPGTGALWTGEHGPRGGDELNLTRPGRNYGWPVVSYGINYNRSAVGTGQARAPGFEEPVYYWDPVIAPSGMAFHVGPLFAEWNGDLLIGSLNPGGLVRLRIAGESVIGEERLLPDIGRVRDVAVAADGSLLLLLDSPDAAILRVTPAR